MSDLIRREDAINVVGEIETMRLKGQIDLTYAPTIKRLKAIPSADRPQGEWVKHDDERDYCSRCKHIFKTRTITQQDKWTLYIGDLGYNYCPNCGARMKGADDEC